MLKYLKRKEEVFYALIWMMVFLFPVVTSTFHASDGTNSPHQIPWNEILHIWSFVATFFVCFTIHDWFIAPLLVFRNKRMLYLALIVVTLGIFYGSSCVLAPHRHRQKEMERMDKMGFHDMEGREPGGERDAAFMDNGHKPDFRPEGDAHMTQGNGNVPPANAKTDDGKNHESFKDSILKWNHGPHGPKPPFPIFPKSGEFLSLIIMILLFGLNVGVKYFFKSDDANKHITELERNNLEQQLEYLKYQINPHFFMNTLNNIHALIDIDPDQAKYTVLVLSKMMRYLLYDGERQYIPIRKEVDFIRNYVELMSIRYPKRVDISVDVDEDIPNGAVPPLLFITFVENAFKHGVSAASNSYIHISVKTNEAKDRVTLVCNNSKHPGKKNSTSREGGVGLKNAMRRLKLVYGENCKINVDETDKAYNVTLEVPTLKEKLLAAQADDNSNSSLKKNKPTRHDKSTCH